MIKTIVIPARDMVGGDIKNHVIAITPEQARRILEIQASPFPEDVLFYAVDAAVYPLEYLPTELSEVTDQADAYEQGEYDYLILDGNPFAVLKGEEAGYIVVAPLNIYAKYAYSESEDLAEALRKIV